jgi:hypothetical protein
MSNMLAGWLYNYAPKAKIKANTMADSGRD